MWSENLLAPIAEQSSPNPFPLLSKGPFVYDVQNANLSLPLLLG